MNTTKTQLTYKDITDIKLQINMAAIIANTTYKYVNSGISTMSLDPTTMLYSEVSNWTSNKDLAITRFLESNYNMAGSGFYNITQFLADYFNNNYNNNIHSWVAILRKSRLIQKRNSRIPDDMEYITAQVTRMKKINDRMADEIIELNNKADNN